MAAIIRTPAVAGSGRQLRRPGVAAAMDAAVAAAGQTLATGPVVEPVTAVPPLASLTTPALAPPLPVPRPEAPAEQALQLQRRAVELAQGEQALAAAQAGLDRQRQALAQQEQVLMLREQQLARDRQQLHEEADAVRLAAEQRGHTQGVQQGEEAARVAAGSQTARLNAMLQALNQTRRALLEEQQDMLVEISFAAVCRVLGAQAATRAGLAAQVRSLSAGEREPEQLTVRLHPQDWQLLAQDRGGLDPRLQLQADDSVELGGCLIDSARGTLDARLELQVQQLRAALLQVRRQQAQDEEPV